MAFISSSPIPCIRSRSQTVTRRSSFRTATVCSVSEHSRRAVLRFAAIALPATLLVDRASAFSLNDGKVRDTINRTKTAKKQAQTFRDTISDLKKVDDEITTGVLRFIPIWLEPPRVKIADLTVAPRGVKIGERERYTTVANTLAGHLLELKQAARTADKDGIVRELDEYIETVDSFLGIPELKQFM